MTKPERHPTVAPAGKHPTQEGMAKADGFRDRVIPGEVERQFPELIERVKTEIRARHYSYRTETSYLDWVRRFIAFHDYADPRGLDVPTAVKIYPQLPPHFGDCAKTPDGRVCLIRLDRPRFAAYRYDYIVFGYISRGKKCCN